MGSTGQGFTRVLVTGGVLWTLVLAALSGPADAATTTSSSSPSLWPLGDSITYGMSGGTSGGKETVTPGGYRGMLDAVLNQDGVTYHFVGTSTANSDPVMDTEGENAHDGHPGYRVDQDAADLDGVAGGTSDDGGDWMTRTDAPVQPDVAIVLLGTNDIIQHYDPATAFPTSNGQADYGDPDQVATFVSDLSSRLQSLLQKIESLHPGTRIVLCDAPPMGITWPDSVTMAYGPAVSELASQESSAGVNVSFVDLWSLFVQRTLHGWAIIQGTLGPDGVHPTSAGYQIIASALRGPVEQQLAAAAAA